jgi:hypothetical protein
MRSWIILIELAFSIILLTVFFLYIYYFRSPNIIIENFDPNNLRYLNISCNNNLYTYEIINLTNNNITICYFGRQANYTYIENLKPIFEYLYSGQNNFNPYILIVLS